MDTHAGAVLAGAVAEAASFAAAVPLLPQRAASGVLRVGLALALIPLLTHAASTRAGTDQSIVAIVAGGITGATFGLGASVIAGAVKAAGDAIDAALGSPPFAERAPSGGPIALLYQLAYATVLLQSGGLTILICELARTGAALQRPLLTLHGLAALGGASIRASLVLALPPLFAQALATIVAGILGRTAPQLGGMIFSTPLSSGFVLLTVTLGAAALWPELADLVRQVVSLPVGQTR